MVFGMLGIGILILAIVSSYLIPLYGVGLRIIMIIPLTIVSIVLLVMGINRNRNKNRNNEGLQDCYLS